MTDLIEHVRETIIAPGLLPTGESLLVGVSGGCDSMVLLDVLVRLCEEAGWTLTVAHLNHQLRGKHSDADERCVAEAAERRGLHVVVQSADVRAYAREHGLTLEAAARAVRHRFFAQTAHRCGAQKIVLAHHADDQVETFFLRLLRGSGSEGLRGMKVLDPSPADPELSLVRPFLGVQQSALKAYARQRRIAFRTDASNMDLDMRRNRVRHRLLPLLRREFQPALEVVVLRTMDLLGAEADFVAASARRWLTGRRSTSFEALPLAVQRRTLREQLLIRGLAATFDLVESLRRDFGKPVMVAPGRQIWRDASGELHAGSHQTHPFKQACLEVDLHTGTGQVLLGATRITWRSVVVHGRRGLAARRPVQTEWLDADKVGQRVLLRHWQPGDRFQPLGLPRPVKLQDLFTNQHIPRGERRDLVVAVAESGVLFWVERLRLSEMFKLTPETRRRLEWRWERG